MTDGARVVIRYAPLSGRSRKFKAAPRLLEGRLGMDTSPLCGSVHDANAQAYGKQDVLDHAPTAMRGFGTRESFGAQSSCQYSSSLVFNANLQNQDGWPDIRLMQMCGFPLVRNRRRQ